MKASSLLSLVCVLVVSACGDSSSQSGASSGAESADLEVKDPTGYYKLFSDPSITQHPADGAMIGDGATISFKYDGSKSRQPAILDYQLFYVDKEGEVRPIGGGSFDDQGGGLYSKIVTVYDTPANGRPGFLRLSTVSSAKADGPITGSETTLGMYSVHLKKSAD